MHYFELDFTLQPNDEAANDIMAALLADVGCEAFVPTDYGLKAYIQQELYHASDIEAVVEAFPMENIRVSFECLEAPDEDWNATWEAEGFDPIVVGEHLVVHDDIHQEYPHLPLDITIHPRQAFGTGTHETTRMILSQLLDQDLRGQHVIDAGCGTGILGIVALKLGAANVFAYDIDEWSVNNTRENFKLNFPTHDEDDGSTAGTMLTVMHGDAHVLAQAQPADLLMANINRNILLADLPAFAKAIVPQGYLILSGFLAEDVPMLTSKAANLGFKLKHRSHDGEWQMLLFQNK